MTRGLEQLDVLIGEWITTSETFSDTRQ